jgi:hypothetical protein
MTDNKFFTLLILILLSIFCLNAKADDRKMSLFGLTVHGTNTNKFASNEMKNKITMDGRIALNPQFNFTFYKDNQITNASFVIDCYANPALYFGKGKIYEVEENLKIGYMFGVYIRQFPRAEEFELGRIGNYQILPTPSLLVEYKLNNKTSLRLNSNLVINFVDLAWSF